MNQRTAPSLFTLALLALLSVLSGRASGADGDADFFTTSVQPILVSSCIRCHGPDHQKAHLRLDTRDAVLAGGKTGPAAVAGKPDESLLIKAVGYTDDDLQMPPKEKLSDTDIKTLVDWVARGLPWNAAGTPITAAAGGAPAPAPAPAPPAPAAP